MATRFFDWQVYSVFNRDLWYNNIRSNEQLIEHWKNNGRKEQNRITYLTTDNLEKYNMYLDNNPDLKKADRLYSLNAYYEYLIKKSNIAVIIHLGDINMWNEFDNYLRQMNNILFDLWITIPIINIKNKGAINDIKDTIIKTYNLANVLIIPNEGFDVGGFFYAFKNIIDQDKKYDYILKIQTKSDEEWRKGMISSYVNNYINILNKFKTDSSIGMVGCNPRIIKSQNEIAESIRNKAHMNIILEHLNIKNNNYTYVSGTMFWVKASIFYDVFNKESIDWFISKLNNNCTYDRNWMNFNKENKIGNILWSNIGNSSKYIRDGMFEHACERVFGIIVTNAGYKIGAIS